MTSATTQPALGTAAGWTGATEPTSIIVLAYRVSVLSSSRMLPVQINNIIEVVAAVMQGHGRAKPLHCDTVSKSREQVDTFAASRTTRQRIAWA